MRGQRFLHLATVLILGLGLTLVLLLGLSAASLTVEGWLLGRPPVARAHPDDLFVEPGGTGDCSMGSPCSLQTALSGATEGDTIYLAQGDYTGSGGAVVTVTQSITLYGGWDGQSTGVPVRDPDVYVTTLNGEGQRRVVLIDGGALITPTLDGLRITNGSPAVGGGGGVYSNWGRPRINNCHVFSNATGSHGGGIYLWLTTDARLTGNRVYSNQAGLDGGGISLRSSANAIVMSNEIFGNRGRGGGGVRVSSGFGAKLTNNEVFSNVALHPSSGFGGGVSISGNDHVTVTGNSIFSNTAKSSGGGIHLYGSDYALLTGNTVLSNTTDGGGGGIYSHLSDNAAITGNVVFSNTAEYAGGIRLWASHDATLAGNEIRYNTAESNPGGGVYLEDSQNVTLTNNMIAENHLGGSNNGAGLFADQSSARLLHTTLARNSGGNGQGVHTAFSAVCMTNTIVVSHTVGVQATFGSTVTMEATLWGDGAWANVTDTVNSSSILLTGTVNVRAAPAFVDPAEGDYHLSATSQAIDAGVEAGVTSDIDGDPRISPPDLGADEAVPVLAISKSGLSQADPGAFIAYTLRVTNTGVITAESVVLTDSLPVGAGFVSASDGGSLESSGVVSWPTFSVAPNGSSVVRTFTVTATETIINDDYVAAPRGLPGVRGTVVVTTNVNHAPVADAGSPQSVHSGTVTLDGSASSDPDDDPLTYWWRQTGGPRAVSLSNADRMVATFTAPSVGGVYSFTLTVTDTFGASDADDTTVTVEQYRIYLPLVLHNH